MRGIPNFPGFFWGGDACKDQGASAGLDLRLCIALFLLRFGQNLIHVFFFMILLASVLVLWR